MNVDADIAPADLEARALWHAELVSRQEWMSGADLGEPDDDDDGAYLGDYRDPVTCWGCGGEGSVVRCMDDLCHGQGYCMHGDGNARCRECGGEGWL